MIGEAGSPGDSGRPDVVLQMSNFTSDSSDEEPGVLRVYLLGLLPNVAPYLPLYLTQSMSLLTGTLAPGAMARAAGVTVGLIAANTAAAVLLFQKRSL